MEPLIDVQLVRGPVAPDDAAPPSTMTVGVAGAECVFMGRTRSERSREHGDLTALDYEAYEDMAPDVIAELARDAAARHGCSFVGVRHSTGRVPVGTPSVLVRVLAAHRAESFAACREVIDRLKASAPIWKRELWADGATWQDGHPVDPERDQT